MRKTTHLLLTMLILVSCGSNTDTGNDYLDEIRKLRQEYSDIEGKSIWAEEQRKKLNKEIRDYIRSLKGKELSTSCYIENITFPTKIPNIFNTPSNEHDLAVLEFKRESQEVWMKEQAKNNPGEVGEAAAKWVEKVKLLSEDQKYQNSRKYRIYCRQMKNEVKDKPKTSYSIVINEEFVSNDEKEKLYIMDEGDTFSFSGTISDVRHRTSPLNIFFNSYHNVEFYLKNEDLWDVAESKVIKLNRSVFFDFE